MKLLKVVKNQVKDYNFNKAILKDKTNRKSNEGEPK